LIQIKTFVKIIHFQPGEVVISKLIICGFIGPLIKELFTDEKHLFADS
jgi:hypothetical protein